jgi:alpha-L-arabinofuranosidase
MIESCSPPGRQVGIAFDEWNVWYAWYRTPGVAEGIYAAAMLNEFCREARKQGMTIGAYFEPINEGAILVDPAASRLTPIGQVMSLFKPHHGRQLLAVEVSTAGKAVDAVDMVDRIDAAASLDEPTGRVTVTLVNPSPDKPATVKLALPGSAAAGAYAAEGTLLSCPTFLPGSAFRIARLPVRPAADGSLTVRLSKHSVARIDLTPRVGL